MVEAFGFWRMGIRKIVRIGRFRVAESMPGLQIRHRNRPAIGALAVQQGGGVVGQMHFGDLADDDVMRFPQDRGAQFAFKTGGRSGKDRLPVQTRNPVDRVKPRRAFGLLAARKQV